MEHPTTPKNGELDWLLIDNDVFQEQQRVEADRIGEAKYGPRCSRCHYRVNDPYINYPFLKFAKPGEHDCFTGDPLAR